METNTHANTKRFIAVKEEWVDDFAECDHKLCSRFHANGCPPKNKSEWIIIDITTNERPTMFSQSFELKRDTKNALAILNNTNNTNF